MQIEKKPGEEKKKRNRFETPPRYFLSSCFFRFCVTHTREFDSGGRACMDGNKQRFSLLVCVCVFALDCGGDATRASKIVLLKRFD